MKRRADRGEALAWLRQAVTDAMPDECVLWPFGLSHGYGALLYEGKVRRAHRVALALVGREPPRPPLETRHTCGQRSCVNPHHLAAGTTAENQADRVAHGTSNRGERQGRHKLTEDDVLLIRSSPLRVTVLARQLGVSHAAVSMARSSRRWAHLEPSKG